MYKFVYVYIYLRKYFEYIGKSTLLNRLSCAGVLAENMLFATLDPTTRRVRLPKNKVDKSEKNEEDNQEIEYNQDTIIEVYMCIHVCLYTFMYIWDNQEIEYNQDTIIEVYMCIYMYMYIYVYMFIYAYVHMYMYIYICIHIYTYI
jgi:hypothetical protein